MNTPNSPRRQGNSRTSGVLLLVGLLVLGLVFVCRSQLIHPDSAFAVERLSVEGSPEEIGKAIGESQGEKIRELLPILTSAACQVTKLSQNGVYTRVARVAEKISPDDMAEMDAMATAAKVSTMDIVFLNVFYSVVNGQMACRQVAVWGDASADGELIHGRNLDWNDYPGQPLEKHNIILDVKPKAGVEYVTMTWPGMTSVITGSNKAGLTIGFNLLPRGKRNGEVSEPAFMAIKRALRTCKTAKEAVALLTEARPMDNGTILISDATAKAAVVLEIFDGNVGTRSPRGKDQMICNANHGTNEVGVSDLGCRGKADAPACEILKTSKARLDAPGMEKLLADRRVMLANNLLSVVFEPAKNKMWLSAGRPRAAEGEFAELAIFEK